jgi:DNA-binding response OmpR family regulator
MNKNTSIYNFECEEESYKILVVEDSKFFNNMLSKALKKENHRIWQAFTLSEALECISKLEFDYVLLDLILPDGDGEEIIEALPQNIKSKVVVLSGNEDIDRRNYLFETGILDYISKLNPFALIMKEILELFCSVSRNQYINILLVDDSKFILSILSKLLRNKNFNVFEAISADDGFDIIQKNEIHLLLLDYEMPDINGAEMLEKLRKDPKYLELPIVMLSSNNNKDVIARVLKNGANDFISKPFENEELLLKCNLQIKQYINIIKIKQKEQYIQNLHTKLQKLYDYDIEQQNLAKDKLEASIVNDFEENSKVIYLPHDILSGDYYSLLKFSTGGHKLFYILDGQGHGISPALSVFSISSMIKNLLQHVNNLDDLVEDLFPIVKTFLKDEEQLSYIFVSINNDNTKIKYLSGGMYPFYIKDKQGVQRCKTNNLPFMNFSPIPSIKEFSLEKFESVVLYSDGIIEHMNSDVCKNRISNLLEHPDEIDIVDKDLKSMELDDDATLIYFNNMEQN